MSSPQDGNRQEAGAPSATATREDGTPVSAHELSQLQEFVPGAEGQSPLSMPRAAWWAILKRVFVMNGFNNIGLLAAGVAFYTFLAFVPLIASIVLIYGLIGDPETVASNIDLLQDIAPPEVLTILQEQLLAIVTSSKTAQGFGLVLSILFSIFGAMRAATAMMAALNIIYEEHETRNIIRTTGVAAAITIGMVGVAVVGTSAISIFTYASNFLAPVLGAATTLLVQLGTWLFAATLISATFAIFYRYAPDRRAPKLRWLSVGSILSTLLWLAITVGFGFYVANLGNYNATYGSLAAVVVFLMWLFLSAYSVLIGAQVNSEIERQTFIDTTIGPDRPMGQRGAVMADSIIVDEPSRILLEKKRRRAAGRLARGA